MTTVVYGTVCAPYQANRALLQLARDDRHLFPKGAEVLERHTYVEDMLTGADSLREAREVRDQLIAILGSAGMTLDKLSSSIDSLLPSKSTTATSPRLINETDAVSILGLLWDPARDSFSFRVLLAAQPTIPITKRSMLSEVALLYDPLGWLAPITQPHKKKKIF